MFARQFAELDLLEDAQGLSSGPPMVTSQK